MIGTHWFNPPPLMKVIEVVRGVETSDETLQTTLGLLRAVRQGGDRLPEGHPGLRHLAADHGLHLRGRCASPTRAWPARTTSTGPCLLAFNHPMGPLHTADMGGLDSFVKAAAAMAENYGDHFRATQGLRALDNAGHYGYKTGRGLMTTAPPCY